MSSSYQFDAHIIITAVSVTCLELVHQRLSICPRLDHIYMAYWCTGQTNDELIQNLVKHKLIMKDRVSAVSAHLWHHTV